MTDAKKVKNYRDYTTAHNEFVQASWVVIEDGAEGLGTDGTAARYVNVWQDLKRYVALEYTGEAFGGFEGACRDDTRGAMINHRDVLAPSRHALGFARFIGA